MTASLRIALLILVSGLVGFAIGRGGILPREATVQKQDVKPSSPQGCAVDCYDAKGNLVENQFAKLGGVQLSCGPGQTPKLHQPPPR